MPTCELCDYPIPSDKRADSRYCSREHKDLAHQRRRAKLVRDARETERMKEVYRLHGIDLDALMAEVR